MSDVTALLRGGPRDGETTSLAPDVSRLLANSDAPGLLEVYEATGEREHVRGNEVEAVVFRHAGQESAEGIAPEAIHLKPA